MDHSQGISNVSERKLNGNIWRFILFRVLFSARFYYPIFTILFLDYGLTLEQFSILNLVWAVTIVIAEVPSGALADLLGRRKLVVFASALMVVEMLLLATVPLGSSGILFAVFLVNRICSGLAEAAASGADEALAYDSLKALGRESEWAKLLEWTARFVSVGFFFAMIIGAFSYDQNLMESLSAKLIDGWIPDREVVLRLPVYLTLATACIAFCTSLGMVEVENVPAESRRSGNLRENLLMPFRQVWQAFRWVTARRFVLLVILAALVLDSVPRQLIILASEYYRLIGIPTAWFGFIGAGLSLLGILSAALSRLMVTHLSARVNYLLLSSLLMFGLLGVSLMVPLWGVTFAVAAFMVMGMVAFQSSYYINREVDNRHRATVLSFRGLALNLALGFASLVYTAGIMGLKTTAAQEMQGDALKEQVFASSLKGFPPYFLVLFVFVLAVAWHWRKLAPTSQG